MGGCNHDTWKQPPASLNVEWPTKSTFKHGPSLEEQKARMRETRIKVSHSIAESGFTPPRWPEVGQPFKWNPPNTSLGDGLTNLASQRDAQSSSVASSIPRRYQSSTKDAEPRYLTPSDPNEESRSTTNQHDSPLLQLSGRLQDALQQPASNTLGNTLPTQDDGGLRNYIDSSIFNPRINVVELPDHMFQWPPPSAPRAMLENMSTQDRPLRSRRRRRHSEVTEASFDTVNTRRVRGYSSATNDTQHTICDCGEEDGVKHAGSQSSKIDVPGLTGRSLQTPNRARAQCPATSNADSRHVLDTPRVIGPPPGFEAHQTIRQGTTPRSGSGVVDSEADHMNGSWSQSLNWLSDEERLRVNFSRMHEKAHHLGWDKSPFLPKSVGEYAALLAERKAAEAKRILKKIEQNEEAARIRQTEEAMVSHRSQLLNANCLFFGEALIDEFVQTAPPPQQQIELFKGIRTNDGLSSVLAMESCFNEIPADLPESERVDWPPDIEFRSWKGFRPPPPPGFSRRRSSSHRGVWPFPRTNVSYRLEDSFPRNEVPYSQRRMIFAPRWDWMPKLARTLPDESDIPAAEPHMIDISMLLPSDLFHEPKGSQ